MNGAGTIMVSIPKTLLPTRRALLRAPDMFTAAAAGMISRRI